jgi:EpsI family protein
MSDSDTPAPSALSRRNVLTGLTLIGAAGFAYARMPKPGPKQLGKDGLDGLIPKALGPWKFETTSGLVLPPPDETADRLYDEVLTRVYTRADGAAVMMLIAYSSVQDGLLQIHRPEVCYPASGYALSETRVAPMKLANGDMIPTRQFTAGSAVRSEHVLYWTRLGSHLPTSWREQRWAVVLENLGGLIPDGILVRVSTVNPDSDKAFGMLRDFASDLSRSVSPKAQKLLWKNA